MARVTAGPTSGGKPAPGPVQATIPGAGRDVGLEVVVHVGLLAALQLAHVGRVLLAGVVQLAALAQHLEVHGQGRRLHVHHLVVGDGGLWAAGRGGGQEAAPAAAPPPRGRSRARPRPPT